MRYCSEKLSMSTTALLGWVDLGFYVALMLFQSYRDLEAGDIPNLGLEIYFFSNSQTFASGFNLNSQIAVFSSQLVFPL